MTVRSVSHGRLAAVAAVAAALIVALPPAGAAATPVPHWLAISQPAPTYFHAGDGADSYEIVAVNDGATSTTGPITVSDTLPPGFVVNAIAARAEIAGIDNTLSESIESGCAQTVKEATVTVACTTSTSVPIGRSVVLNINVHVPANAAGLLTNQVAISGGGAQQASTANSTPVTQASQPVPYGASVANELTDSSGHIAAQAGSHPFAYTTLLDFNVASVNPKEHCNGNGTPCPALNAQAKDVEVALPPGLVGNPTAVPYCTHAQFENPGFFNCPASSQVGSMYLYFYGEGTAEQYAPIYNIEPPPGQPGELGFTISTLAHIAVYFHVRSDGDYGLTADIPDINQFDPVRAIVLSVWGVPSDEAHNPLRLSEYGKCGLGEGGCPSGVFSPRPFLTLPTSCTGGRLPIGVAGDSWQNPESAPFASLAAASIAGIGGCEALPFSPSIAAQASTHQPGVPAGYDIHLDVPQSEETEGLSSPDVRNVEVTLPHGTVLSPSAANGLVACTDAQFALKVRVRGACPPASKIGTIKITTPLLAQPIAGSLYVGQPECSPCSGPQAEAGQMLHLLLEAEGSGVVIKLSGHTRVNEATGQLTTTFAENPQLPFSDLEVSLERGPGAPLANPSTCGPAITTAHVTPWSTLTATNVAAPPIPIEGCTPPAFSPSFTAGMTSSASAGAFSRFSLTLSHQDGEQTLGRVTITTPPGLLGMLKGVTQCPDAQANVGTCPAASQIGTASVTVGPGSSPLTIAGGTVYLTGPYDGKPFGLTIVTPAEAGPFKLSGNTGQGTEVVRASIAIDPHTSAITVASDALPQQLNGVPLDVRNIKIDIDRPGFMFNPTDCNQLSIGGAVMSANGTVANVSFPFQAVNCATLPFKPAFTVLTQGKTSKANGAYLHVKVVSGPGQANIGKVKVDLPKQLPSRLTTLQQACPDATFNGNPASCPAGSLVGTATAVTPVLKNALTGPAYLVSHAGAAFPDLVIVLQGEGITLDLVGNTDIKKGVTISTFNAVPDAPIATFDLVLPQGPHSALAAYGNLCKSNLNMPTAITGQNGSEIRQTTRIAVSGCPRHKHAKKARRPKTHRKGRSGRR
jgi:hypothetical protein